MGIWNSIKNLFSSKNTDYVPDLGSNPVKRTQVKEEQSPTPVRTFDSKADSFYTKEFSLESEKVPESGFNGKEAVERVKDFVTETGKEVKEQGEYLFGLAKDKLDQLDESTQDFRNQVKSKANEVVEKVDDFIDKTIEKGKEMDAKEAEKDIDKDGFADKPINFGDKLSEKHSDFFDKAEKFIKDHEATHEKIDNTKTQAQDRLELPKE